MRNTIITLLFFICLTTTCIAGNTLIVYLPSNYYTWIKSLQGVQNFEQENHVNIQFVSFDGTGKMLSRLHLECKSPRADIVMGLSQVNTLQAKQLNLLSTFTPKNVDNLQPQMKNFLMPQAIPFDYGNLAILYNPKIVSSPPKTLMELANSKYKIIICDPQTSSTGQDFLLWTIAAFGPNWTNFWYHAKNSILYIAPSWDSAFAQFEIGTAPIMISYASDEAYSYYTYNTSKYKIILPSDGSFQEVEYMALVNKKNVSPLAKSFINLMLTPSIQSTIPLNNWMMPSTRIEIPKVFQKYYPHVNKVCTLSNIELETNLNLWIAQWQSITLW